MPIPSAPKNTLSTSAGGVIFISVVGVLGALLIFFGGLLAYYLWQIKYGNSEQLVRTFDKEFTLNPNTKKTSISAITDVKQYVRPYSPIFGNRNAKITILQFADFECPFTQKNYEVIKRLSERYGPAVKFVFKYLPVEAIHPHSLMAAEAAACANDQGKFWEYHNMMFEIKKLDRESLIGYAKTLRLNSDVFSNCLDQETHKDEIEQDLEDANELQVRGTPTFFVNKTKIEGAMPEAEWGKLIVGEMKLQIKN